MSVLIACAHGTNNPVGQAAVDRLRAEMLQLRPGLDIREAYVDVQQPELPDVVASLPPGRAVVVPLLLSVGYHVKVDIARAVKSRPDTLAAAPLGPDPRLAALLRDRLREAGVSDTDPVVLAAAGSSDACASEDVRLLVRDLEALRPGLVRPGFGSKAQPPVPEAVQALREEAGPDAGRLAVASYLLAPGYFHDQLAKAGSDVVSAPLLPATVLAELALARYDDAVARFDAPPPERDCGRPCRESVKCCVRV